MRIRVINQDEASGDEDNIHAYGKAKSKRFIITEHNGEQLQWNFPPRTWNSELNSNLNAFEQINSYFDTLDKNKQAAIFNEYRNINLILRSINGATVECDDLIQAIRPCMRDLYSHIDPQHLFNWVWDVLKPIIPLSSTAVRFDPNTMPGTKERTYLLDDYRGLIPLSIVIRAACPVWFDFASITNGQLSREHKDIHAYSLIESSWPAKSQQMARLEEYVDHTIGNDRNNPANILIGIGTDEMVNWSLSSLVVHKLPVVDIMGYNVATPVVAALFHFVKNKIAQITSSQPSITNKFADSSTMSDENNQSYLEGFRNRIALTVGQEAFGDYYLERQIDMIRASIDNNAQRFHKLEQDFSLLNRVAPGIDVALVIDALESTKVLNNIIITEEQLTIAAWLFQPYSQARAVGNFLKERIVVLLALAQAVLLHHGKVELAKFVTAGYQFTANNNDTHSYTFGDSISPLHAKEREQFRSTFPFEQSHKKKPKNFVFEDVYNLVNSLQNYDINCTFSQATLERVQSNNPNRKCFLKRDSVMMFMNYAKWIAERPIVRINPDLVFQQLMEEKLGKQSSTF